MRFDDDDKEIDPRRRTIVLSALAAGLFTQPLLSHNAAAANAIFRLRGQVQVNGSAISADGDINAGDLVETGPDGFVVFSVEKDAFILRRNSRLQLSPPPDNNAVVEGLRVLSGALLSVFASRRHTLRTPYATIGIRGTGVYVEAEPDRDYVCTCYGETDLVSNDDPNSRETVSAGHHTPRYILADGASGERIREAPFINHTDAELTLIESIVGRVPEFSGDYDGYERPRRETY